MLGISQSNATDIKFRCMSKICSMLNLAKKINGCVHKNIPISVSYTKFCMYEYQKMSDCKNSTLMRGGEKLVEKHEQTRKIRIN